MQMNVRQCDDNDKSTWPLALRGPLCEFAGTNGGAGHHHRRHRCGSCWPKAGGGGGGHREKKILEIAVKSHETKKPLNQTSKKTTVGDPRPLGSRGPTWSHPGCPGVQLMPVTGIVAGNWKIGNTVVVICIFSLKCSTKIILIYESFSNFVFHHCPPPPLSLQPRGAQLM